MKAFAREARFLGTNVERAPRGAIGIRRPQRNNAGFSQVMLENEHLTLGLLNVPEDSRCVFLTASGTGTMEEAVMSVLKPGRGAPTCPRASHSPSSTSWRASMTGMGSASE